MNAGQRRRSLLRENCRSDVAPAASGLPVSKKSLFFFQPPGKLLRSLFLYLASDFKRCDLSIMSDFSVSLGNFWDACKENLFFFRGLTAVLRRVGSTVNTVPARPTRQFVK